MSVNLTSWIISQRLFITFRSFQWSTDDQKTLLHKHWLTHIHTHMHARTRKRKRTRTYCMQTPFLFVGWCARSSQGPPTGPKPHINIFLPVSSPSHFSLDHTHTYTHHTHTHLLSYTYTHSLSTIHTHTHIHSPSLSYSNSPPISLSLKHSHTPSLPIPLCQVGISMKRGTTHEN